MSDIYDTFQDRGIPIKEKYMEMTDANNETYYAQVVVLANTSTEESNTEESNTYVNITGNDLINYFRKEVNLTPTILSEPNANRNGFGVNLQYTSAGNVYVNTYIKFTGNTSTEVVNMNSNSTFDGVVLRHSGDYFVTPPSFSPKGTISAGCRGSGTTYIIFYEW